MQSITHWLTLPPARRGVTGFFFRGCLAWFWPGPPPPWGGGRQKFSKVTCAKGDQRGGNFFWHFSMFEVRLGPQSGRPHLGGGTDWFFQKKGDRLVWKSGSEPSPLVIRQFSKCGKFFQPFKSCLVHNRPGGKETNIWGWGTPPLRALVVVVVSARNPSPSQGLGGIGGTIWASLLWFSTRPQCALCSPLVHVSVTGPCSPPKCKSCHL